MCSPGMAFTQPVETQPQAFKYSPFFECLNSVLRAGGRMSAMRASHRRNSYLVKPHKSYEHVLHGANLAVLWRKAKIY